MEGEGAHPATATATTASHPARVRTPEGLRQRQRDRLSPRGRFATKSTAGRISTSVREVEASPKTGITLWPAPRSKTKTAERRSPDLARRKQLQDGLRKDNSFNRRARKEAEDGRLDITPDGGSAGREGRQFTVANVGNNGKIYLRPTVRPANQRYPQPSFVFPNTPPSTAGLDVLASRNEGEETQRDSLWTPTRSPSTPAAQTGEQYFPQTRTPSQRTRQKRAHSYSTIDEHRVPDAGAFKIVIERPGGPKLPEPFVGIPTLEVPIPSYKLGTPRFSTLGTAFLRGSSYTATDDMRSSIFSHRNSSQRDPSSTRPARILSRRHSDASPLSHLSPMAPSSPSDSSSIASPLVPRQRIPIAPEMFDALTFKPACDHPSVVRYCSTGNIRAATPARLVAEITSPTFVDYDLLSDFFLSFRSFLETSDLLNMLIARLKWALARTDETGTVVRVRTFVAIRHWILNYFLDDYVVDYELRKSFCDLLNTFVSDLSQNQPGTKVPLKILGELKKCWRRVCALYWDGPEFDTDLSAEVPITPGGVAGSRNPTLDPTFWAPDGPPQLNGIIEPDFVDPESTVENRNYFADVSRAGHLDSMIAPRAVGMAREAHIPDERPQSPISRMSEDVISCSFPSRARAGAAHYLGAHPVPASSIYDVSPPVAMTPKALTGKRVRPTHAHKRSGSFSDSYRDRRVLDQPVQKVIYKSTELFLALPYAGSLVRGNLIPPGQAFVDEIAPSTPADMNRATTLFPSTFASPKGPSAMSGPGMKKLLGSVRRALSTRTGVGSSPNSSPTQGSFPHIPPLGIRGATINRLPGTAVVPQARHRNTGIRAPMRIDLLGAEIAEDFKKAVREDAEADAEDREAGERKTDEHKFGENAERQLDLQYSTMAPDATLDHLEPVRPAIARAAGSEMTNGSKSILIVDDTLPSNIPAMTGALPLNPSVDTFADAFMHPSGGPTPPSTPPEAPLGIPRRSSHLLGQHTRSRPHSFEGTPSLVVDSRPSGDDERSPTHRPLGRLAPRGRAYSYKSKRSVSLRRYASYHSGFTRHKSDRSFDATTYSESEIEHMSQVGSVPLPLRVLRRRPGGDLRAVTNIGDLNAQPLRRPMSTGSLTTYSDSVRSSYLLGGRDSSAYVDVVNSDYDQSQEKGQKFSLGALAEASPKPHVSLFSTHSSQPIMRPSFEKEAQMLAQIPDDIDDDGGVESALLKLEGKFEQRHSDISGSSYTRDAGVREGSFGAGPLDVSTLTLDEEDEEEKRRHRHEHVVEKSLSKHAPAVQTYQPNQAQAPEELKPAVYQPRGMNHASAVVSPRSIESYNSIPLLERGLTDDGIDRRRRRDWSQHSILRGPSNEQLHYDQLTPESSHVNSFDFIDETDSMRRIPVGQTIPNHESPDQSFLNSDSEDRSDLSSELSLEVISRTEYTEQDSTSTHTFPPIRPGTVVKEVALPCHPLRHPPSPPMTLTQALQMSPPNSYHCPRKEKGGPPPTPEFTPTGAGDNPLFGGEGLASPSMDPLRAHRIPEPSRKTSVHLPFTLAFDSQILAQQFTLIEKDALNEIDWKDLIEMRWKDTCTESRSWVNYLRKSEPRGVEVVIARFNLMVKWAVSECVLTKNLEERVRCIIKYIHIAAHCRKYRNFATMTQLTVALTSKDISRLTKTWAYVPAADLQTLKELENLVTPTGNFHSLRAEMEGAGADQGCIPFVGIYTHDLLVNSERPSQMASTPTTEPLVNFGRCRTDATIIKNLLRLLEASQLYRFLPIEGVTERCLWMAALSDEEIARYGKMIQE
ncbi:Guanine nucleotide exchange factor LTE1 [Lachnellula suecica]|uniref:Guanine nucleotide exchange factor LTE1 n=1 Tax=Lachnellula suecica TaxID=602035 RepID=A0A8T9BW75_9HELO|nr:Guanine nucleotide exchange factor LTE1 [Lachnellula suecica]